MPASWKISGKLHDMSLGEADAGEVTPIEVRIDKEGVTVDLWPDHDGMVRSVWIEMKAGSVMVRCYNQENEEPYTVQIDSKDIMAL